jgi:hypothetical protein
VTGEALVGRLFEVVAQTVADEYSPHVTAPDFPARVVQVVEALRGEGILAEVVEEATCIA